MIGIILALAAVLIVICIVFGCAERTETTRSSSQDLSFLDQPDRKKN